MNPRGFAVVMLVALSVAGSGCQGGNGSTSGRSDSTPTPTPDGSDDTGGTPTPAPDHTHCRAVLNEAVSTCGAQFTGPEGVIPQNDLLDACGQTKVECVVGCYDQDPDCAAFRACLAEKCSLS